jgi:hypothetical protein
MSLSRTARVMAGVACSIGLAARGQPTAPGGAASQAQAPAAAPAADKPVFKPEELEQILAPIALYPDSLLSQVLMASTYPVEVVEADRWVKANPNLKGDALTKGLEQKPWDPSVKSLVTFPQVLATMSENLGTTVKIGDAFIGQQKQVMDTIQQLRGKAQANGNLNSSNEQKVTTQSADGGTQVIVIESSSPDVVYVPQYNPTVVYGAWPYPAYPPYPYYPPGYVASNAVSFGLGVAVGAAWGYAWGNCNWGHGDVDIDVNQNFNRNTNIDRSKFQGGNRGDGGKWRHDPAHRQGAAYRNRDAAARVGAASVSDRAAQARNQYRGRAEAGRTDLARGGADQFRGSGAGNRGNAGGAGQNRPGGGPGVSTRDRPGGTQTRPGSAGSSRGGAFNGVNQGGAQARQASGRGNASRSASPSRAARPAPSSRPSGGARGGGGGRGGGGRGGGRR